MTTENPAPGSGAAVAGAPASLMARLGRNEQLVLAGGAAAAIANILGLLMSGWGADVRYWGVVLGGIAAAALVLAGGSRVIAGLPATSITRILAAIVGAFALIDLGDTIPNLGNWGVLDIILTIVEIVAAAALAYGAWAASGGSLASDAAGVGKATRLPMSDAFLYVGGVGVVVAWFLYHLVDSTALSYRIEGQVAVLLAVLLLAVRWVARNPSAGRLPMAASWTTAGLAAVVVLLGLWNLIQNFGDLFDGIGTIVAVVVYILAIVALGLGAFLGLDRAAAPPAAR